MIVTVVAGIGYGLVLSHRGGNMRLLFNDLRDIEINVFNNCYSFRNDRISTETFIFFKANCSLP